VLLSLNARLFPTLRRRHGPLTTLDLRTAAGRAKAATVPAGEKAMDENFSAMSDPDFLAERRRVREVLEHTPEHEVSAELSARFQKLDEEFLRRASLAWTQAR
jgi:hypothetical protein